jgi:hypothetical protein
MDEKTLNLMENPIKVDRIWNLPGKPGFRNFNLKGDRSPFRNITGEKYDLLGG